MVFFIEFKLFYSIRNFVFFLGVYEGVLRVLQLSCQLIFYRNILKLNMYGLIKIYMGKVYFCLCIMMLVVGFCVALFGGGNGLWEFFFLD